MPKTSDWTSEELTELKADLRQRYAKSVGSGPRPVQVYLPDDVSKLLRSVKSGATTIEEICDSLELCPREARSLVSKAQELGYAIDIDGQWVGRPTWQSSSDERVLRMPAAVRGASMFAVASDLHIGSKHHMRECLQDFVNRVYDAGVRTILVPGDILDGVYRFSIWEQNDRGFDEQALRAIETLPKKQGLTWAFILGNHDETFSDKSGIDVGGTLVHLFNSYGRNDIECVGARGAYVRLQTPNVRRGLVVELWHPKGSPAYSISYKPQRHVEQYSVGAKPDVMLVGHFHQAGYFIFRGVHCIQAGTFQGGKSSFGRSLGGSPAIGGWIIRYAMTEDGTVRDFAPEWIAYYEHEAPRELGLG